MIKTKLMLASFIQKLSSLKNLGPLKKVKCLHNRYINGTLWFIAASRNAFAVIGGCFVTYFLEKHSNNPFTLTGKWVCLLLLILLRKINDYIKPRTSRRY